MRFLSDSRAQSVQVGAVILFGVLIILLSTWQAFVVPDQNEGIEFNHNGEVQQQMTELRSTVLSMPGADTTRSVTVNLGLRYPSRTVFLNPPPVSGTLQTLETTDQGYNITIANAQPENDDLAQLWAQQGSRYNTGAVEYRPSYNQYQSAPRTIYAHSVLYNKFDREDQQLPVTGQSIVRDDTISLVALNGTLTETRVDSSSVDFEPVSTQTRKVEITPDGGPITLEIPTRLNESRWETLLVAEDNVASVSVDQAAIPDEELGLLSIELEDGSDAPDSYTLQLAKVGLGTSVTQEQQAYVTDVAGNGSVIQRGETQALTVEVRDQFNKPLTGTQIKGSAEGGIFDNGNPTTTATTSSEGQATLQYTGTVTGDNAINVTIEEFQPIAGDTFNTTTPTNLTTTVTVNPQPTSGGGGGGSGAYNVTWVNPETDSQVTCSPSSPDPPETCTIDANASSYEFDLTMETDPIADGAGVTYSVSNQTVGTVSSKSGTTDSAGTNTITLNVTENGTVNAYVNSGSSGDRIEFTVVNITSRDTTPSSISGYQATNPSGTTVKVSFDSSEELSNIDVGVTNDTYTANITAFSETDNGDGTFSYTGSVDVGGTGQYKAVLNTAEDTAGNDGASGESDTVTVGGNSSPTASFAFSPTNPEPNEPVQFDATSSTDSDGTISSYSWNFGDGSTGAGDVVNHTYSSPGRYTVMLTVADDDGATDNTTKTVNVRPRGLITAVEPDPDKLLNSNGEFIRVNLNEPTNTNGWTITDDDSTDTSFPDKTVDGTLYFARDPGTFVSTWGVDPSIVYQTDMNLANVGEALKLGDASSTVLDEFAYEDGGNYQTTNGWNVTLGTGDVGVRKTNSYGNYQDTNTADDWRIENNETAFFGGENDRPSVTAAIVENAPLDQSDIGNTHTVTIRFDETMDTAVQPTVGLSDLVSSDTYNTSLANGGTWIDNTTWQNDFTLEDDGDNVVSTIEVADAEDQYGKAMVPDTSNTVTVDTVSPSITPVDPQAGETVFDEQTPIEATVSDSLTGVNESSIQVTVTDSTGTTIFNDVSPGEQGVSYSGDTLFANVSELSGTTSYADGPVNVNITANDGATNAATNAYSFTVGEMGDQLSGAQNVQAGSNNNEFQFELTNQGSNTVSIAEIEYTQDTSSSDDPLFIEDKDNNGGTFRDAAGPSFYTGRISLNDPPVPLDTNADIDGGQTRTFEIGQFYDTNSGGNEKARNTNNVVATITFVMADGSTKEISLNR